MYSLGHPLQETQVGVYSFWFLEVGSFWKEKVRYFIVFTISSRKQDHFFFLKSKCRSLVKAEQRTPEIKQKVMACFKAL